MKYLVTIKYDGTFFHGFQRQNNVVSVQKTLEDALSNYLKEEIVIKGSGRTDALVHALGQTFHFEALNKLPLSFKHDLNKILMPKIEIKKVKRVNNNFHARHDAKKKHYLYKINLGSFNPSYVGYVYQPKTKIDIKKIRNIKNIFIGTYDFHNFVSGYRDNYITTIYKIKLKQKGDILEIHFWGKAFYRYMVRNLVGAILDYEKNKVDKKTLKKMLENKDYNKQLKTAPPEGLYLVKVYY